MVTMSDLIRISYAAMCVIPAEHRNTLHSMYEDGDVDGAEQAERDIAFLEREAPGVFVGILAHGSVSPPCTTEHGHYQCDYYDPTWTTVLVSSAIWQQYYDAVMVREQQHKDEHQCKVKE